MVVASNSTPPSSHRGTHCNKRSKRVLPRDNSNSDNQQSEQLDQEGESHNAELDNKGSIARSRASIFGTAQQFYHVLRPYDADLQHKWESQAIHVH